MNEQEYNGWTNHETWATMLHIDNDQALLEIAMDYATTAREEHRNDDTSDPEACLSMAIYCLSETLKSWLEDDLLTRDNIAGNQSLWLMLSDIGSLYRVNYNEIADTLISYVLENEQVNA